MTRPLVALIAVLSFGCATNYTPRPSPYIVPIQTGLGSSFMRNGQRVELGFWGSGAVELVAGNPAAEERARGYKSRRTTSLLFFSLTEATILSSLALVATSMNTHSERQLVTAWVLFPVGLVFSIPALYYAKSSRQTLLDAVNIYNDGVKPLPCP